MNLLIAIVFLLFQPKQSTFINCGIPNEPDPLVVYPSGRIIYQGESFLILGDIEVDPETGVETIYLEDGTIQRDDLYICEDTNDK